MILSVALLCLPALAATMRTEVLRLADTRGSAALTVSKLEGRTQAIELEILRGQNSQAVAFLYNSEELQELLQLLGRARGQIGVGGHSKGGVFTLATTAQGRMVLGFAKGTIHLTPADVDRLSETLGQSARVLRR